MRLDWASCPWLSTAELAAASGSGRSRADSGTPFLTTGRLACCRTPSRPLKECLGRQASRGGGRAGRRRRTRSTAVLAAAVFAVRIGVIGTARGWTGGSRLGPIVAPATVTRISVRVQVPPDPCPLGTGPRPVMSARLRWRSPVESRARVHDHDRRRGTERRWAPAATASRQPGCQSARTESRQWPLNTLRRGRRPTSELGRHTGKSSVQIIVSNFQLEGSAR